jgi:ABC-type transporter Mla subunit MlaD
VANASRQLAQAVDRLEAITTDAIGRMNASADVLAGAAVDFAKAGEGVRDVMGRAENVGRQLVESAGVVSTAVRTLDAVVSDYKTQQTNARGMLDVAQKTVESARREAALTEEVVRSLGEASKRLTEAQRTADQYLEKVSDVLAEAHSSFAENVTQTLKTGNQEFYEALSRGTKLLKEAISELEATLASLPVR